MQAEWQKTSAEYLKQRQEAVLAEAAFDRRALAILACLLEGGYEAWIVGGAVRDFLMGRPLHDIDITTEARPDEVISLCQAAGYKTVPTGLQHGTVTVIKEKLPVEVTTFRADGPYSDSRRPDEVYFTTDVVADLARRDFTVNAILWRPDRGCYDPMEGKKDLAAGLIRAVGDPSRRFTEDALRILRAIRFAAQLGFAIEVDTRAAMDRLAGRLCLVARERVTGELSRFVLADRWPLQQGEALWPHVFSTLATQLYSPAAPAPAATLDSVSGLQQEASESALSNLTASVSFSGPAAVDAGHLPSALPCRLAALYIFLAAGFTGGRVNLTDLADEVERTVDTDLRLSNKDRDDLINCLNLLSIWVGRSREWVVSCGRGPAGESKAGAFSGAQGRYFERRLLSKFGQKSYDHSLDLLDFICKNQPVILNEGLSYEHLSAYREKLLSLRRSLAAGPQIYRVKDLAVGGADLVRLGFKPGPDLGHCLDALLQSVQAELLQNRPEDLLAAAKKRLAQGRGDRLDEA